MTSPGVDGVNASFRFVESLDLSGLATHGERFLTAPDAADAFDGSVDQSVLVGAEIVSFTAGVTAERREAISNSALLAQLVATKRVPSSEPTDAWYDAYFDVLTNLGWVLQDRGFTAFEASSREADVAVAVLDLAANLLGGATTTAYRIIEATLDGLKKMHERSPWITLFERESHHANSARFQVSLTDSSESGDFLVRLMAFSLEASSSFGRVLFYKFQQERASLRHYSASVSVNDAVFDGVSAAVKDKVVAFTQGYVQSLPDLS
jgi:hypothetical protein